MDKKKVVIFGVIVVAIVIAGVFVMQKKSKITVDKKQTVTQQQTDQQAIDTSDWKTYKNEKFGYEIKYPNDVFLKNCESADVGFTKNKEDINKCGEGETKSARIII